MAWRRCAAALALICSSAHQAPQREPPELLLALGITCAPDNQAYRDAARLHVAPVAGKEHVALRFVLGAEATRAPAIRQENATRGDLLGVACPEGGGPFKQAVLACKVRAWYSAALRDLPPALWYGKLEDDHWVAIGSLAFDLRNLAGRARAEYVAYGSLAWLQYDAVRFWNRTFDVATPALVARFGSVEMIQTKRFWKRMDGGCYRGPNLAFPHGRLLNASYLGALEIHFSKKNCIYQRSIEAAPTIFPFLVSGEILSAPLAKAVAACRYATDFVKRHVEAVAAAPVLATREALRHKAAFAPGGDALSGHFWRRCLAPGARLLLAVLPFRRAHNGPLSTSRNNAPPTTESILIHPLKFHSAAARAWFERAAVVSTGRVTTPRPPLLFEYRSPRDGSPATLRHASPRAALANVRQIVHEDSLNTVVQRRQAIAAAVRFALRLPDAVPDVEREFLASTVGGGGDGDGDGDATADIGSFLRRFEAEAVASREPDPPFSFSRSSTGAIPLRDLRPPPPDSEWLAFMAPDRPGSPPPAWWSRAPPMW